MSNVLSKIFDFKINKHSTYNEINLVFFGIKFKTKTLKNQKNKQNNNELINFLYNNSENDFVPLTNKAFERKKDDIKPIAFYLPQFHTIPLNDKFIEKGFCEWTNVTKTKPQFLGHYQPHLPIDTGFYDLTTDKVMYRQVELAKLYGIYGFCFHYYWFSGGKRLLETPLFNWLNNKELNFPFCLCWANETWAKQWDGGNKEIMMEQKFSFEDCSRFFYDILPFLKDERYIKIDNKPLLIIYNPKLFKEDETTFLVNKIRELAKQEGVGDLFILGAKVFKNEDSTIYNMDATVEFYPNGHKDLKEIDISDKILDSKFSSIVFDVEDAILNKKFLPKTNYPVFRTIFPIWDNSARKAHSNGWVFQSTPKLYKKWLKDVICWTKENKKEEEQIFFINAWNEWAEGAHLEPDRKFGYAYLQATKEVLEEARARERERERESKSVL